MRLTPALVFDIFLNNLFRIFTYGCYEIAVTPEHGFPVILCYLFLTTASRKTGSLCFYHPDKIQQVYFRPASNRTWIWSDSPFISVRMQPRSSNTARIVSETSSFTSPVNTGFLYFVTSTRW